MNNRVYEINFSPARPDAVGVSYGNKPHTYANFYALFSVAPSAEVTCDGKPVTAGELFAWLLEIRNGWIGVTFRDGLPAEDGIHKRTDFVSKTDESETSLTVPVQPAQPI